jgi:hypothetical protein
MRARCRFLGREDAERVIVELRSSTRATSSDELFSPIGQLAAQTRITPAASSWRTPPSQPRASACSGALACGPAGAAAAGHRREVTPV